MTGSRRAEVIADAASRLAAAGVPDPGRDARHLFRWAAQIDGAGLAASLGEAATADEIARFDRAIGLRAGRMPVSQITGRRAFWGREFVVTRDVLDPRPETETLIAAALGGRPARRVLDLGVGSGCILLTLLAEWPGATGIGIDRSADAVAVARRNAERLGVEARAEIRQGCWFDGIDERFDLVVSNPPYIPEREIAGLAPEVRDHEPRIALAAGEDGLVAYRAIAAGIGRVLPPGGRLLLEIGAGQEPGVAAIFRDAHLQVEEIHDLDGRVRCISATT